MQRTSRAVAGGVVVFVLVLVAAVSGLVALVGGSQLGVEGGEPMTQAGGEFFMDPVTVEAEVLDVDGEADGDYAWLSVDVRFDTPDGGTEVAMVDLGERTAESPPPPQVGDVIEIVHERDEPGFAVRADDPMLTEERADDIGSIDPGQRAAAEALVRRSTLLAVCSLGLALLLGALTVVAVARAPAPAPPTWAEALPRQDAHRPPPEAHARS